MTKSDAIAIYGSKKKLADALGIWPSAITQWPEDAIPRLREYEINEQIANGDVPDHEGSVPE